MTERIKTLAERAVHESLFIRPAAFAANPAYASLPEALRIACTIRDCFRNYPIRKVSDGELLTDAFFLDPIPVATCAYRHAQHNSWRRFFHPHSDYYPNALAMVDWNHYCNNYRFIVENGFKGFLPRIEAAMAEHGADKEKRDFLEAAEIVCRAVGELAARYGQRVPYEPPATFAEAVETVWFSFLLMPDSVGRLDQVLYPFYRREIDAGTLTKELAEEYIAELLIKVFSHVGPGAHRSGDNTLVIGGYTPEGEDGFNDVSRIIAEALAELPIWRPQCSFRWTKKTPHAVTRFITECNKKNRNIVFTNDEARLAAFEAHGVSRADAIDYSMIGCNEWSLMGKSNRGSDGFFNTANALEETLYFYLHKAEACADFEAFFRLFSDVLHQKLIFLADLADAFYDANAGDLNILSSLMTDGCIEEARSITAGGAKYNFSCWSAIGLVNTADSLSVIRQFVYEEQAFTMAELIAALRDNWRGQESMRTQIQKRGRFFGCGDKDADEMVNRVIGTLYAHMPRGPKKGGEYLFGCYTGYNHAHISMGLRTRATPDGRYDGDAFTGAIIAAPGKDKNGLTAYLKSAASLDYTRLCAPLAVNLRLDPGTAADTDKLTCLYETYFALGGMQLQPDYVSAEELRDAQMHPDCWRSLRVRITGFTGYFTQFERSLQDELISRTEHAGRG
ncbi:MAG: hypothetical protein J6C52_00615 [Clostridia bacterium]|nr:hypothetical protein [Clostridia bacterium]